MTEPQADRADAFTPLASARSVTPEPETALDAGIEVLDYLLGP